MQNQNIFNFFAYLTINTANFISAIDRAMTKTKHTNVAEDLTLIRVSD